MEKTSLKILVCGDVNGKLNTLYARITNIMKKSGNFEMLLCVGNFFGSTDEDKNVWEQYKNGTIKAPIVTYILGPNQAEQLTRYEAVDLASGGELCENITYLGRCGVLQCPSGLNVAYVSGLDKIKCTAEGCYFTEDNIKHLYTKASDQDFKGVDILLTSQWPQDITSYGNKLVDASVDASATGSRIISDLAVKLRPRYHFTALESTFYERLPYRNHQVLLEPARHVTRFLSLGNVGNTLKKKYLYAFNIAPLSNMSNDDLIKQPDDVTENPYIKLLKNDSGKQNPAAQENTNQNFFFDTSSQKRKHDNDRNQRQPAKRKGPPPIQGPCWFCLGGSEVEKHLVVSVAENVYLAMAKGGLTPNHTLICPIAHYPSTVELPDDALMEIEKYKSSLRKMFKKQGYTCVIYERNFYTQHLQIQVIPVPKDKADDLKGLFMEMGSAKNMEFDMLDDAKDLKEIVRPKVPFFLVEFDDGTRLFHRVKSKMPLQFGREVLASHSVLDMEERVDWKSCKVSKDEEKKITGDFRKKFQPFDFSLA